VNAVRTQLGAHRPRPTRTRSWGHRQRHWPHPGSATKDRYRRQATQPRRKVLSHQLPREDVLLDVPDRVWLLWRCSHLVGKSVSEMLDGCRLSFVSCAPRVPNTPAELATELVRANAPERSSAGSLAMAAQITHVLISKYSAHLLALLAVADLRPPRRRSLPFGTRGLGWQCMLVARGLARQLCKNVFASNHLFADDTPISPCSIPADEWQQGCKMSAGHSAFWLGANR
jgi:transposase